METKMYEKVQFSYVNFWESFFVCVDPASEYTIYLSARCVFFNKKIVEIAGIAMPQLSTKL